MGAGQGHASRENPVRGAAARLDDPLDRVAAPGVRDRQDDRTEGDRGTARRGPRDDNAGMGQLRHQPGLTPAQPAGRSPNPRRSRTARCPAGQHHHTPDTFRQDSPAGQGPARRGSNDPHADAAGTAQDQQAVTICKCKGRCRVRRELPGLTQLTSGRGLPTARSAVSGHDHRERYQRAPPPYPPTAPADISRLNNGRTLDFCQRFHHDLLTGVHRANGHGYALSLLRCRQERSRSDRSPNMREVSNQ
jgi:hypothetical protein